MLSHEIFFPNLIFVNRKKVCLSHNPIANIFVLCTAFSYPTFASCGQSLIYLREMLESIKILDVLSFCLMYMYQTCLFCQSWSLIEVLSSN